MGKNNKMLSEWISHNKNRLTEEHNRLKAKLDHADFLLRLFNQIEEQDQGDLTIPGAQELIGCKVEEARKGEVDEP